MITGYVMVSFQEIKQQYKQCPIEILKRLVGNGKIEGGDYVALNPRRSDKKAGSFRIDISSGKFYDFATGDCGGSILNLFIHPKFNLYSFFKREDKPYGYINLNTYPPKL